MRRGPIRENLTDRTFGLWYVEDDNAPPVGRSVQRRARCRCLICGEIRYVQVNTLRSGASTKCVQCTNTALDKRRSHQTVALSRPRSHAGTFLSKVLADVPAEMLGAVLRARAFRASLVTGRTIRKARAA